MQIAALSEQHQFVRVLHLDPVEALFSFICSSNNNVKRITQMVEYLCTTFGRPLATLDGRTLYSFASVDNLSDERAGVEQMLRDAKFGYRAAYIACA